MDLKSMTRKELEKLLLDVKKALKSAQARDRREARKAAAKAAAQFGFALDELEDPKPAGKKPGRKPAGRRKTGPGKAKYRNPENPKQTWTGKGRQPNWFRTAVDNGTDPASLAI